ncbi:Shwachman-Bodian-Diamond syndrome protein, putative [Perkinsus marinus ATCC 50983]|uniref:Shwachman-Bodian-Diamond syndrome protein, putative n=1 Tax=Perkinsus marinus (strain ATCC 50983 / TXsc) TaxID=423536 RepID=C5LQQ3_PERM5|nr:Shwachman-Bodian-Diamond syndrome protein, putative [Perkinsus marinus ATCC 50983]EER00788.1 Shwachman-Bodian-Diamond syndrome protein, putative [Perkinsus marinus ATCC 50983]|eukprot:XP_002768070.1 Shwachman-Bodian-Diamond syndrome protein, putative [Perkinsus marinus ATCC 50983]
MINQPVGQKRLTNIAIVSMKKKCKKREYKFEIACYPNKVVNSRQGIETDLDEVLQSEAVYTNVSRGDRALAKDLKACFGTTDQKEICKEILMHGTLQITGTEREFFHESRTNEVITQLAEMCIDSRTGFPLTKDQISSALQDINYQVRVGAQTMTALNKSKKEVNEAKLQAREAMKALEEKMPE